MVTDSIIDEIALKPNDEKSFITVVGVGGGGGNAVKYMWNMGIRNVSFLVCNTDQQALDLSPIKSKICLGKIGDNKGHGAGNDPLKGRAAAIESIDEIMDQLKVFNTKMVFITAGMGGGTGTGAAPVIAKYAKEMGILTVAIVTLPLLLEGPERYRSAMKGIQELRGSVDSMLIIDNENIQKLYFDDPVATEAFDKANEILALSAKGISEIVTMDNAYINVDFADVSRVMTDSGRVHMSVEQASGKDRARIAVEQSLVSPLLEKRSIRGAKKILLSIATSAEHPLRYNSEMCLILKYIQDNASVKSETGEIEMANVIWGMNTKPELGEDLEIVLVATGFDDNSDDCNYSDEDLRSIHQAKLDAANNPESSTTRIKEGEVEQDREPWLELSPIANGENVTLPEREPRYANIERLLRTPAYIARKAKLRVEESPKRGGSVESGEGELF